MTIDQARDLVTKNNLYLGCMIIKTGGADGQISGALSTTGETLRPALQIIKCAPGISCVSGAMLLISEHKEYGEDGVVVMSDVAVTPNPTADQLAQFAYCTAETAKAVAGIKLPIVAMLSYSTKGSAKDAIDKATGKSVYVIDKVVDATKLAKERYPELHVDGEMQADAALVPAVARKKAPQSNVAGRANVLIVPNLEVGNIGYKLVQRLGGAQAIGPILQGIARPVNDLSRGCSVEDIYYMIAITRRQKERIAGGAASRRTMIGRRPYSARTLNLLHKHYSSKQYNKKNESTGTELWKFIYQIQALRHGRRECSRTGWRGASSSK